MTSPATSHTATITPHQTLAEQNPSTQQRRVADASIQIEFSIVMESFPVQFCRNIRLMWRRRRYQRIADGSPSRGRKGLRIVKLGSGGSSTPRRTWKLRRAANRLRVRLLSPVALLGRVKDAYINAMLRLAGKGRGISGVGAGADALWAKRIPKGRPAGPAPLDFETRILVEIYKSFLAPNQLAAL